MPAMKPRVGVIEGIESVAVPVPLAPGVMLAVPSVVVPRVKVTVPATVPPAGEVTVALSESAPYSANVVGLATSVVVVCAPPVAATGMDVTALVET